MTFHQPGPRSSRPRVTAVMTCFNRAPLTLRSLAAWFDQHTQAELDAVIVDDGSRDRTAEKIAAAYPQARVVRADGDLYWAGGMSVAEAHAVSTSPDYLCWLNDDVVLHADALDRLLNVAACTDFVVVAGAVTSPNTGATTYGGVRRVDWHPMRFRLLEPTSATQQVDTVHGNILLVPRTTYSKVSIDGGFAHAYADFDYGLRVVKEGGKCLLAPGWFGTCESNAGVTGALTEARGPVGRLRFLGSRKGLPMRSQARYLRRHGGWAWPLFVATPYAKALFGLGHRRTIGG